MSELWKSPDNAQRLARVGGVQLHGGAVGSSKGLAAAREPRLLAPLDAELLEHSAGRTTLTSAERFNLGDEDLAPMQTCCINAHRNSSDSTHVSGQIRRSSCAQHAVEVCICIRRLKVSEQVLTSARPPARCTAAACPGSPRAGGRPLGAPPRSAAPPQNCRPPAPGSCKH
jgi:hypothetical protein